MKLKLAAVLAAGLVSGAIVQATAFGGASPQVSTPTTIHLIEHAINENTADIGAPGDSPGDVLTFHNPVFNKSNTKQVAHDNGSCVRTIAGAAYECMWTTFLPGGHITVEGPFFDAHNSVAAVTGGTGVYRNARGQMILNSRAGGTQFDFIFELQP